VNARIFRFDDWTLDLQSGELQRGDSRTRLQEHPLQVLASLLESPGNVVSREQLIGRLWPDAVVDFDTGLNTAVRKLRAALGDTADTPRYIETVPRRGYRFIGVVDVDPAATTPGTPAPSADAAATVSHTSPLTSSHAGLSARTKGLLALGIAAAIVVAGLLAWSLRGGALDHRADTPLRGETASAFAPPPHSIAVLPFVNLSDDRSQDYFSDGLSEELLNALSRIDELQVAAQTSSFYFKGKSVELATISHKLNVATVLEGSVRRSGHTVRITAQLVNAATGFHVWSQTYDRNLDDVLAVQSEIASSVATALKVTLLDNSLARTGLGGTRNALALDEYLKGIKLFTATVRSGEEAREAVDAFSEAIRLDANFALAYTGRARSLVEYGSYFMIEATREAFSKAKADATRAIELAPDLGEAHAALAQVYEIGFLDFTRAAGEYARAMALSPGDSRVLQAYSNFEAALGHADIAITTARRSIELDPLNVCAQRVLGNALEVGRRYDEAIEAFGAAIKLNPSHATEAYQRRGRLYYIIGNYQLAQASCAAEPDTYQRQSCMPLIYEKLGQHETAQAALAALIAEQGDYSSYQYAEIYAQWGQPDQAIDWLDTGARVYDPGMESVKTDTLLDPIRSHPRFQELVRSLNFPP
jgi:TolB-like protein/DNA-binding winged helix-turn-helix (wHTH) protein